MRSTILFALLASLAACSNSQGSTPPSSTDASLPGDANADADANTCIGEASPGVPCMQSLADYCANGHGWFTDPFAGGCGSTWQTVQAEPPCQVAEANYLRIVFSSCASADTMALDEDDTATVYVYDPTDGALVAVLDIGDPGLYSCLAGPACFTLIPPNYCGSMQKVNCGGGDAAAGDTGAMEAD